MSEKSLLDGLRVVELATFVFGPAAGTVLADFGADVVHIEHPQIGDAYRYLTQLRPMPACVDNYCWILTARGKRSIALDLHRAAGRAVALELVRRADVFITNLQRAGVLAVVRGSLFAEIVEFELAVDSRRGRDGAA